MGFDDYNNGQTGRGGSQWGNNDWEAGNRQRQEDERIRTANEYNRVAAERAQAERDANAKRHRDAMNAIDQRNREQRARWDADAAEQSRRQRQGQSGYRHAPAPSIRSSVPFQGASGSCGGVAPKKRGFFRSLIRFVGYCVFAGFALIALLVYASAKDSKRQRSALPSLEATDSPSAVGDRPSEVRTERAPSVDPAPVADRAPAVADDPALPEEPALVAADDPAPVPAAQEAAAAAEALPPEVEPTPVAVDQRPAATRRVAMLGIEPDDLTPGEVAASGLEQGVGRIVRVLTPGLPAAEVLKVGDIITAVDGVPIRQLSDVRDAVRAHEGSDPVLVSYYRGKNALPLVAKIKPVFVSVPAN